MKGRALVRLDVSRQSVKQKIDLVKFLHKNELNKDLKGHLADLGDFLNKILIQTKK